MVKIAVIGVGGAGREVIKKIKDDGLNDVEILTVGVFQQDDRDDIPHLNLIEMNGEVGLPPGGSPQFWRKYTENVSHDIERAIDKLFDECEDD